MISLMVRYDVKDFTYKQLTNETRSVNNMGPQYFLLTLSERRDFSEDQLLERMASQT